MGKTEHSSSPTHCNRSFSSFGKSKLALFMKKSKEKKIRRNRKEEKRNESSDDKNKGQFWRKWLNYVLGRWSSHETVSPTDQDAIMTNGDISVIKTMEESGSMPSNSGSNVTEILDKSKDNISKILTEPAKSGTNKVLITQFPTLSSRGDAKILPGELQVEKKLTEEIPKDVTERLNNKTAKKETPDIVSICNTSVQSVRPNAEVSKGNSNNLSDKNLQKSVKKSSELKQKFKEEKLELKSICGSNEKILATLKTASEPIWTEKETLRQKMRIQEHLNELLEQFMFLEAEDLMGLPVPTKSLVESNKLLHFNRVSSAGIKDIQYSLSREVSPEILVNIKPFKEYLSEDYMNVDGSRGNLVLNNKLFLKEEKKLLAGNRVGGGSKLLVKEHGSKLMAGSIVDSVGIIAAATDEKALNQESDEKEINTICYEDFPETLSLQLDLSNKSTSGCTIWGVYKSYSSSIEKKTEKEEETKETENDNEKKKEIESEETGNEEKAATLEEEKEEEEEEEEEEERAKKQSVDEVLDSLDDSDHDVVFRRNISQFKKKISGSHRHDSNSSLPTKRYPQHKKTKSKEKKIEYCRYEVEPSRRERKLEKILENFFLYVSEASVASQRQYRTQVASEMIVLLENPQTVREVLVVQEWCSSILIQREMPAPAKDCLIVVKYISKNTESIPSLKPSETSEISHFVQSSCSGDGKNEDTESTRKSVSEAVINAGRNTSQNSENLLCNSGQKNEPNTDSNKDCGEILKNQQDILENRTVVVRKGRITTELAYLPISKALQVLNDPWCHYGVVVCEKPYGPSTAFVSRSEPNVVKKNAMETKTLVSDSAFGDQEIPWPLDDSKSSSLEILEDVTDRDSSCDGFRIIYNNSNLDIEADGAKTIVPSFGCLMDKILERIKLAETKPDSVSSRTLRFKSNSFPKETIAKQDRSRRSLIPTQKRRTPGDTELRRTGSAKMRNEGVTQKKPFGKQEPFGEIHHHHEELKTILPERKGLERKKMMMLNKKPSVRKELAAAFNSIKELKASKDGNRRMSLVIMFSKK